MFKDLPRSVLARLAHPKVGIVCAMLTAVLCAVGSGVYQLVPHLYRYRLWNSWSAPRWHTIVIHLLLAILALWCIHGALRLLLSRSEPTTRSRSGIALGIVQLVLPLALGAYLWVVVRPPQEEFVLNAKGTDVHGEFYRILRMEKGDREANPPKPTVLWMERRVGEVSSQIRVESRQYWASASKAFDMMVMRATMTADGAILRNGPTRVTLSATESTRRGPNTLRLRGLRDRGPRHSARVPAAELTVGGKDTLLALDPEWAGENAFLGVKESPVCLLRVHRNLCLQLGLIAATVLLAGGLLLLSHRRCRSAVPQ